ncbi:MAG: DUF1778 domain-containing protein [Burkholderiaceae bacterium]
MAGLAKISTTKGSRLHIRCDQDAKSLLDKAAGYARMTVSEFVLKNALEQAESLVQAYEPMRLSSEDFVAFLNALDAPPKKNEALQRAFDRHAKFVA